LAAGHGRDTGSAQPQRCDFIVRCRDHSRVKSWDRFLEAATSKEKYPSKEDFGSKGWALPTRELANRCAAIVIANPGKPANERTAWAAIIASVQRGGTLKTRKGRGTSKEYRCESRVI
jgi:hypothetical protein